MSRIGKNPVSIPQGVDVNVNENLITVKGKLGELTQTISEWYYCRHKRSCCHFR